MSEDVGDAAINYYVFQLLAFAQPDDKFPFDRNGYFVADLKDHTREMPVFNMAVSLKDSWSK